MKLRVFMVVGPLILLLAAGDLQGTDAQPPAEKKCSDPLTGARQYDAPHGEWFIFTLTIKRDAARDRLIGSVVSHAWEGGRGQASPPSACGRRKHYIVTMGAFGRIAGDRLTFGGEHVTNIRNLCGRVGKYNPDSFSGRVDLRAGVFRSLLNDRGRAVNEPVVFRRIECR